MTGTVFLETAEYSVLETEGILYVAIVRTGDTSGTSTISYSVTANSAAAGIDFVAAAGEVTFEVGETRVLVPVVVIDDTSSEQTENFAFSIVSPGPGTELSFPRTAQISILDDENPTFDPLDPPLVSAYNVTEQVVASGITRPINIDFAPFDDTLIFIAEQGGRIRIFDTETNSFRPDFINLSSEVNLFQDRGLLDIAFHPDFANNPYVYAFYVVDPQVHPDDILNHPLQGLALPDQGGNRFAHVVRFTADASTNFTSVVPGSKVILAGGAGQYTRDISGYGEIDSTTNFAIAESGYDAATNTYVQNYIKLDSASHAGGALAFGPDGALYVSIGDGTSFNAADPRSASVQRLDSLSGKILRIDPITGQGLPDNPFASGQSLDSNQAKVYQLGLRNPFSMGFSPDGRLFITNTGWNSWEEVETGPAGANFGWPWYEGGDNGISLRTPGYQDLPEAAAFYAAVAAGTITLTPAYRAFGHLTSAPGYQFQAITGGNAFLGSSTQYPSELQGFIFTDVVQGEVYIVDANDRQNVSFLYETTNTPVHWTVGPDGYLYYASLYTGEIGRLQIERKPPQSAVVVGDATFNSATGEYTLTSAAADTGGVAVVGRIDVRKSFALSFDLNLGSSDGGGEGIAFYLHSDPTGLGAFGAGGGGMGIDGVRNGLAFEIDTAPTAASLTANGSYDPAADHAAFLDIDGPTSSMRLLANIEDGQWHRLTINWDPAAQILTAVLDGQQVGVVQGDIAARFLGDSDFARFAVAGASSASPNEQRVKIVDIQATFEFENATRPVALSDFARIQAGTTSRSLDVLDNDTDPNGNPLSIVSVTAPLHGTASIDNNGTPLDPTDDRIVYQPVVGYAGPDHFTYTVSDGTQTSAAMVSIEISPPKQPWQFVTLGSATFDQTTGVYTLAAGIFEAGAASSLSRIDVRRDFTIAFEANLGTNELGADGMAVMLHNDPRGAGALGALGSGLGIGSVASGIAYELDTYFSIPEYIISGGPDIANDHAGFLDTDSSFATTPFDLGQLEDGQWRGVVIEWNAATQTLTGRVDGVLTSTLTSDIVSVFLGGSPYANFAFAAGTGGGSNDHRLRNVDIRATFEGYAPFAATDAFAAGAVSAVDLDVRANDSDPYDDPLSIVSVRSATGIAGQSDIGATLTLVGSGASQRVRYDASSVSQVIALAAGAVLTDQFTYEIEDAFGGTATATAAVTITGVNDAPAITSNGGSTTATISVAENTTAVTDVDALDPDTGAAVTYSIVGGVDASRFSIDTITGVLRFVAAPDYEQPQDIGTDNVYNVEVQASDGLGGSDVQALAVTVTDVGGISPPASNAAIINGTPENDVLAGLSGGNAIFGFDGNDSLSGAGGADTLDGGNGNDTLVGGLGNDSVLGGAGDDLIRYGFGEGIDTVDGGLGSDSLTITGTSSINALDVIYSGTALTRFENGTILEVESVTADLLGGVDLLSYQGTTAALSVNLVTGTASGFASIAGVENVTGGSGADSITGDGQANLLTGGGGADTVDGGLGNDTLVGGLGNDRLLGGGGDDTFLYGFGEGIDTVDGGTGTADRLEIRGTASLNALDVVFNGTSLTRFESGNVSNVEIVTADLLGGSDLLSYLGTTSAISVNLGAGTASGFTLIAGIENVTGGNGADTLVGSDDANEIKGGNGNDTITGGLGNDTLDGGAGFDRFVFAPGFGNDVILAGFDFDPAGGGQDRLDITAFGVLSSDFDARVGIAVVQLDTLITIDANSLQTIRLIGVGAAGQITSTDFIL